MIFRLFPGNRQEPTIKALYGAIVAQARAPVFYRDYGVPDTVNGRFDMIVLHLALLLDRMEAGSEPMRTQGQAVFDLFCREMDGHFREIGHQRPEGSEGDEAGGAGVLWPAQRLSRGFGCAGRPHAGRSDRA